MGLRPLPRRDEAHDPRRRRRAVSGAGRRSARQIHWAGLGRVPGGRGGDPPRGGRRTGDDEPARGICALSGSLAGAVPRRLAAVIADRQRGKAEAFRALHQGEPFVIPNPWDAGSARVLEALGFEALATTSSGFAFTLGRLDGGATLEEVLDHVRALDRSTSLPVSVDLENGYGPDPQHAASAVARVAEAGAVGGSIED